MNTSIPKKFLKSKYRKEMWRNTTAIMKKIEKIIPISEAHLLGSFTTKKRRPADVDFVIFLKTSERKKENWSLDMVISPDNINGEKTLNDAKKWVKQKYGSKNAAIIRLK